MIVYNKWHYVKPKLSAHKKKEGNSLQKQICRLIHNYSQSFVNKTANVDNNNDG